MHPGGFSLLQADWCSTICTTQVWLIIIFINCTRVVIGSHSQWEKVCNPSYTHLQDANKSRSPTQTIRTPRSTSPALSILPHASRPPWRLAQCSLTLYEHSQVISKAPGVRVTCIQDALILHYLDSHILGQLRPLHRSVGDFKCCWDLCSRLRETMCHILPAAVFRVW
jgi:hypothetical protein